MALTENRAKNNGILASAVIALPDFCRRVSVLFFILLSLQLLYIPERPIQKLALELSGSLSSVISGSMDSVITAVRNSFSYLNYLHNLREENIALTLELARLQSIEQQVIRVHNENKSLKASLNFAEEGQYQEISARLTSITTGAYAQSAIVKAGENHGVIVGQIVMSKNRVIGRVVEVSDNYSRVMLITDTDSRIPVISSHSRLQAVVAGNSGNYAQLLYLPENSNIQVGEAVVTSGDGMLYPAGLEVGRVSRVENGESYITPTADLSKIEFVTILHNRYMDAK